MEMETAMNYRNLTETEISALQSQGCFSDRWQNILVKEPFCCDFIRNVCFKGMVKIGAFHPSENQSLKQVGIYDSEICDCALDDDVLISNVQLLKSYDVGKNAVIRNVGFLAVEGDSSFGNGAEITVLNEGGGREIKMYDCLTAQIAYLMAIYRHRPLLIERLSSLIDAYVQSKTSTRGTIGENAVIVNCPTLKNVCVGSCATIDGANRLENGTIVSNSVNRTTVGGGVYAKEFIIQSGSAVDSSAILTHVFVGQAVKIGKQFSAEHSAFFANCEGFHGEACSIFAGPYTVSHHKSTLLIAGLFSFYNAGSGSNQSNHMYKLGPNHQGILQRGSKTGSFSYLLWPCAIGPFSVVIGKHYSNFDTTDLPFSYINEEEGKSLLTPAMNLFTVGTRRDSQKWPSRDRRKGEDKLDLIHFDLFSPYIVGKVVNAANILQSLYDNASKENEYVSYNGVSIKRLMLKTCRKYYEIAIKIFLGDCLLSQWKDLPDTRDFQEFKKAFIPSNDSPTGDWLDICGLLAPASEIEDLLSRIENRELGSLDAVAEQLRSIYNRYERNKWAWCCQLMEATLGSPIGQLTKEQIARILDDWKTNRIKLNNLIVQDAQKEFDQNARIGYGLDGDEAVRDEDFKNVRGDKETNSFIRDLQKEIADVELKHAQYREYLQKM